MKLYLLTDEKGKGQDFTWSEGVTHAIRGKSTKNSDASISVFEHPLLAVMNSSFCSKPTILWECTTTDDNPVRDGYMKTCVQNLTVVKKVKIPEVTFEQRVMYGILCAQKVHNEPIWGRWADRWISRKDRSEERVKFQVYLTEELGITANWAPDHVLGAESAAACSANQLLLIKYSNDKDETDDDSKIILSNFVVDAAFHATQVSKENGVELNLIELAKSAIV
jgi:hypothetical protein